MQKFVQNTFFLFLQNKINLKTNASGALVFMQLLLDCTWCRHLGLGPDHVLALVQLDGAGCNELGPRAYTNFYHAH